MKSAVLSSTVAVSFAILASAAPAAFTESDGSLVARQGSGASKQAGKKIAQAAEKWALNPQGAMDRDQRKKNRESAINMATGGGSSSATRNRHPELQRVMNANSASNAFSSKKYGKSGSSKRELEDLEVREYDDLESGLVARQAFKAAGKKVAKAAESWALNPQGAMDRDQRKKNRDSAINMVTGGGSSSATRNRHPELQKVMNANSAANAFSSKKYGKSSSSKRELEEDLEARDYDDLESGLVARQGSGASKQAGKKIAQAAEKWALNPQGAMDRDQRKKNRESAINMATGGGSSSATRNRHPELQRVMNANTASNAFSSKKYGKSGSSKRELEDDLEVRDYDDLESGLVARQGSGASKQAGKKIAQAAEKWALNPQGAMDRDQRKKNRESAINMATGGGSSSATRNRHPELQRVMNANSASNAFSSKKYGKSSSSKRELEEDLEARDYDDELYLEARDYNLDILD